MRFFSTSIFWFIPLSLILLDNFANGLNSNLSLEKSKNSRRSSQLSAFSLFGPDTIPLLDLDTIPLETLATINPLIESEILGTTAHVILDLTTFVIPATPFVVQFLMVIGRVFCIAADYIPDHAMLPEEFAYQIGMLAVSITALTKSVISIINANTMELSIRDHNCFETFFHSAGVTWMQYKMLMASAIEWEELTSGSIITSEETVTGIQQNYGTNQPSLYLLYEGELEISCKGKVLQTITPKTGHLIGDIDFAFSNSSKKIRRKPSNTATSVVHPRTTTRVSSKNASILRIDILKLKQLMMQDSFLDQAMQSMIFISMQARIQDLILAASFIAQEQEKKHRKCFDVLFQYNGLSWNQYKQLLKHSALELKNVTPGSVLISSDTIQSSLISDNNSEDEKKQQKNYLYWLYQGELKIYTDEGKVLRRMTPKNSHLFGNLASPIVPSSLRDSYNFRYNNINTSVRVASMNSVILCIDTNKMKDLMNKDKLFKLAIQELMYLQECEIADSIENYKFVK